MFAFWQVLICGNKKSRLSIKVTGISSEGVGGTFTVTTTEKDGFGMYAVENYALAEIQEGSKVTV